MIPMPEVANPAAAQVLEWEAENKVKKLLMDETLVADKEAEISLDQMDHNLDLVLIPENLVALMTTMLQVHCPPMFNFLL